MFRLTVSADEIVTYSRKLCLGGLAVFVGRGTMAQSYFVATVEAVFLMHHMRAYPDLYCYLFFVGLLLFVFNPPQNSTAETQGAAYKCW